MKSTLFSFGPVHIYSYGAMIALGIMAAIGFMIRLGKKENFTSNFIYDLVFTSVVSGFIGARIFYVVQNYNFYILHPLSIFAIWEGGLIYYGGVVAALIALYFFAQWKKVKYFDMLDFIFPYLAFVHAFGRIGCFLNGCCYGRPCDLPWGIRFPNVEGTVHPTQLYEMLVNFVIFFFLTRLYPKRSFSGQVTALYFIFYGLGRFLIEFWRVSDGTWFFLSWNQWISIVLILLGVALFKRWNPQHP